MIYMIIILILISILIIVLIQTNLRIYGSTHRYMTRNDSNKLYKCSYEEFKKLFAQVKWEKIKDYDSLQTENGYGNGSNYIHASIIKINGIGLLLNDIDYWKACKLIKSKVDELRVDEVSKFITTSQFENLTK